MFERKPYLIGDSIGNLAELLIYDFDYRKISVSRSQIFRYISELEKLRCNGAFLQRYADEHPNNSRRWRNACTSEASLWEELFDRGDRLPTELEIHSSGQCLLNCWYCCSPHSYAKLSNKSFSDLVLSYFEELSKVLQVVQFSGGREPLMDPFFAMIAKAAKEYGFHTRLNTSAVTNIADNRLPLITPYIDYIAVSLDAPDADVYNTVKHSRLSKEGFNRILIDIEQANLSRSKATTLELVVLILPENIMRLDDLCAIARKLRCSGIRFRKLKTTGTNSANAKKKIRECNSQMSHNRILQKMQTLRQQYSTEAFSVHFNQEDFLVNTNRLLRDKSTGCYSCYRKAVLTVDGSYAPCARMSYAAIDGKIEMCLLPQGKTIFDYASFRDLWAETSRRRSLLNKESCEHCFIADRYLNNFIDRLKADRQCGIPISSQFYKLLPEAENVNKNFITQHLGSSKQ